MNHRHAIKMNLIKLLILAAICTGSAQADPPFDESVQLVLNAVAQGRTLQGRGRTGPTTFQAMAVPYRIEDDECVSVGLIRIASATVEDWRLCSGRLEQLPSRSPGLAPTSNPQVAETVRQAEQAAASTGQMLTKWGDYQILARRLPESDSNGCAKVEGLILIDGFLLSRNITTICK
jgi:hypothetical protein